MRVMSSARREWLRAVGQSIAWAIRSRSIALLLLLVLGGAILLLVTVTATAAPIVIYPLL